MSQISRRRLAAHVAKMITSGASHQTIVNQVAAYLVDQRLDNEIELLLADIAIALEDTASHGYAAVTSATPLSPRSRQAVIALIKQQLNVKTVELEEHIDQSVVGGVRIETADTTYDATVRRKLQRLGSSI